MPRLTQSLASWDSTSFTSTLKSELETLGAHYLPLERGTTQGGYIGEEKISITVNRFEDKSGMLQGSVGVFFTEIVINCGCGSDPMPINAYCELSVCIDKLTAAASFAVIAV